MRNKSVKRPLIFLVVAVLLFLLIRAALYDGLAVREYEIQSDKLSRDYVFAVVSDLHSTEYGEGQEELLEILREYSTDAILLPGDILDDQISPDAALTFLRGAVEIAPTYFTAGNHERWLDWGDIYDIVRSCGVTVVNEPIELGEITLYGIADPVFYEDFDAALQSLSPDRDSFSLLLSHRPEYAAEYAETGFDLTVSGHAHGGQVRLPFTEGLYAPNQGFFPKYTGGVYEKDGSSMVISRGLMKDSLPRIFNPPEVVIIRLKCR